MTTKYEWVLRKDLPGVKAGTIGLIVLQNGNENEDIYNFECFAFRKTQMFEYPDFFEKREVKPKRWRSKQGLSKQENKPKKPEKKSINF